MARKTKSMEEKLEALRKILNDYVASGKKIEDLRKVDLEYSIIANAHIVGGDGHKLSVEEKFTILGFPRKRVRNMKMTDEQWATEAKALIKQYKDAGGRLEDLDKHHKVYQFISMRDLIIDGKRLNLEEKFTFLGETRARKNAEDVEEALRDDIENYLAAGGSFHVRRKSLPFYERLHSFTRRRNFSSFEEAMKSLGYRNYSDTYFRFMDLQDISKFCDENGNFVYKREMDNSNLHSKLHAASDTLHMPAAVIITLLYDKKLESCVVETDYVEYLRNQLEQYVEKNGGSLVGIRRKDQQLYSKLRHFKTYAFNDLDDELSTEAALAFFGLEDVKFRRYTGSKAGYDVTDELKALEEHAKGGVVNFSEFSSGLRQKVYINACRQGISIKDYLGQYGIEYKGLDVNERFRHVRVNTYPYLDEMKQRRDELIAEMTEGKELCKEELFETRVLACQQAYEEYKERINNFTGEKVEREGKNLND